MNYSIKNIQSKNSGMLLGTFDLHIGPFIIKDFCVFNKEGEHWVSSPARKYESNGATKYFSYVRCQDKEKWESFQNWALDTVLDVIGPTSKHAESKQMPEDDDLPF